MTVALASSPPLPVAPGTRQRRSSVTLGDIVPEKQQNSHHFTNGFVPLNQINIFEQVRKTIDMVELAELVENIREVGLMQPPLVTLFTKTEALGYLSLLNEIWGRSYTLKELTFIVRDGKRLYPVLLYGH